MSAATTDEVVTAAAAAATVHGGAAVSGDTAAHVAPDTADQGLETAAHVALPDVFSFTVEVLAHGFHWVYFGPNSAVLLGDQLCALDTSFEGLLRNRSLREDAGALAAFLATATSGTACEVELRMEGVGGAVRWVLWRVMPRREDGRTYLDGVATDVSRRRLGLTHHAALLDHLEQRLDSELLREHAAIVRDANDAVLQRIFAAGLRLRVLQRRLDDVGSHAAEAIAFQLDQAANDLRHTILELEALSRGRTIR